MKYLIPIFFLLIITSCREISVDDITADNYKEILEKSEKYSLDKYPTGLNEFSYVVPPRLRAVEVEELKCPWKLYKSTSDDKVRRSVGVHNLETNEYHLLGFENLLLTHISFEKLSDQRFSEYLRLLAKFGYTYKESILRDGNDILIKRIDKNMFVVVENDLRSKNRLLFDIYVK